MDSTEYGIHLHIFINIFQHSHLFNLKNKIFIKTTPVAL